MDRDLTHYDIVSANPHKQVALLRHKDTGKVCYLKATPENEIGRSQAAFAAMETIDQSGLAVRVDVPQLAVLDTATAPADFLHAIDYGKRLDTGPNNRTSLILTEGLPGNAIIFASLAQDLGWVLKDRAKGDQHSLARELLNERYDYMHEALGGVGFTQHEMDDLAHVLDELQARSVTHNDLGNNICVYRDPQTHRMHFGLIDWETLGIEVPGNTGADFIREQANRFRTMGLLADEAPPRLPPVEFFYNDTNPEPQRPLRQMDIPVPHTFLAKRQPGNAQ